MNKIYDEDVDFSYDKTITEIPEGTVFNGEAYFYGCTSLTAIPEGTVFNGYAYFDGCTSLTTIPESVIKNCKGMMYLPQHLNPNPSNVKYV